MGGAWRQPRRAALHAGRHRRWIALQCPGFVSGRWCEGPGHRARRQARDQRRLARCHEPRVPLAGWESPGRSSAAKRTRSAGVTPSG